MTLLDDEIDDLLQAFRADEALLDDSTRTRMWDRICEAVPDAPATLDTLAPAARVRRLRRPGPVPRARVLAVAAVVLVLLAVAGLALRTGPGDSAVTAGPAPTEPLPRDLQSLADAVTGRTVPLLDSSPDARYTHVVVERTSQGQAGSTPTIRTEERWVAVDGSGHLLISGQPGRDELFDDPAEPFPLGGLSARRTMDLRDDPDALVSAFAAEGTDIEGTDAVARVVEALAYTGIPGPARAAMLRYLDRLGFVPVTAAGLAPTLLRVEGPGPGGSTQQADLDLLTGEVVASVKTTPQGGRDQRTYTVADLRADRGE